MLKAKELRIGNYVKYESFKKPIQVSVIDTTETNIVTTAKFVGTRKCRACAGKGKVYTFPYGSNGYQRYRNKLFTYDEINDLKI